MPNTKIANVTGPKGAKGTTGGTGNTGSQGPPGNTGLTGAQGLPGPRTVSANANNKAILGSDSLVYVPLPSVGLATPSASGLLQQVSGNTTDYIDGTNNSQAMYGPTSQPVIWSVRMRSINAVGNPTFEVDQRNIGNATTVQGFALDRWTLGSGGAPTPTWAFSQKQVATNVVWPGTSQVVSRSALQITLTTPQASLSTNQLLWYSTTIEGPGLRPLIGDVHSLSLLVNSSVAPFYLPIGLNDFSGLATIVYLVTIPTANTWTLIQLPNIPVWFSSGTWQVTPGNAGYLLSLGLAVGASKSVTTGVIGLWGNYSNSKYGAQGATNFAAQAANSTFQIGFVQHEPGPYCTPPIDCPFQENLLSCQRYWAKSNGYPRASPTNADWQDLGQFLGQAASAQTTIRLGIQFPVEMAKVPTMTFYDHTTVAGSLYVDGVGSSPVTPQLVTASQCGQAALTTGITYGANSPVLGQWRADTGW
jgi:hypothetical protein